MVVLVVEEHPKDAFRIQLYLKRSGFAKYSLIRLTPTPLAPVTLNRQFAVKDSISQKVIWAHAGEVITSNLRREVTEHPHLLGTSPTPICSQLASPYSAALGILRHCGLLHSVRAS